MNKFTKDALEVIPEIEKDLNIKITLEEGLWTKDGPFFYWQVVCGTNRDDMEIYRTCDDLELKETLEMLANKNGKTINWTV